MAGIPIQCDINQQLKGSNDICYNMDEPWKHHAKWKKSDTDGHILCGSIIQTGVGTFRNRIGRSKDTM